MQKKGILFDMDGTLINTYENINFKPVSYTHLDVYKRQGHCVPQ